MLPTKFKRLYYQYILNIFPLSDTKKGVFDMVIIKIIRYTKRMIFLDKHTSFAYSFLTTCPGVTPRASISPNASFPSVTPSTSLCTFLRPSMPPSTPAVVTSNNVPIFFYTGDNTNMPVIVSKLSRV